MCFRRLNALEIHPGGEKEENVLSLRKMFFQEFSLGSQLWSKGWFHR